jgi:hypothetical protein
MATLKLPNIVRSVHAVALKASSTSHFCTRQLMCSMICPINISPGSNIIVLPLAPSLLSSVPCFDVSRPFPSPCTLSLQGQTFGSPQGSSADATSSACHLEIPLANVALTACSTQQYMYPYCVVVDYRSDNFDLLSSVKVQLVGFTDNMPLYEIWLMGTYNTSFSWFELSEYLQAFFAMMDDPLSNSSLKMISTHSPCKTICFHHNVS